MENDFKERQFKREVFERVKMTSEYEGFNALILFLRVKRRVMESKGKFWREALDQQKLDLMNYLISYLPDYVGRLDLSKLSEDEGEKFIITREAGNDEFPAQNWGFEEFMGYYADLTVDIGEITRQIKEEVTLEMETE